MTDPHKSLSSAYSAVLFVGGLTILIGLITVFFEIRFLEQLGFGWNSIFLGILFLVLSYYTKRGSMLALSAALLLYGIDGIVFMREIIRMKGGPGAGGIAFRVIIIWFMVRGIVAIRELNRRSKGVPLTPVPHPQTSPSGIPSVSMAVPSSASGPKPVSFVSPSSPNLQPEPVRKDALSKSITPEILNLRFVAYRCEISADHFKAIYQNATQRELKWFEISELVIRQFPYQAPWEGKLLMDIVPVVVAGEKIHPVRILSSTYVNYTFLPQGQSASTKENIRRMASFIISQNRSIFVDPGTDYFVHAGQPPVRFVSMSQFTEYDARYS